jgi:hypothetical protein
MNSALQPRVGLFRMHGVCLICQHYRCNSQHIDTDVLVCLQATVEHIPHYNFMLRSALELEGHSHCFARLPSNYIPPLEEFTHIQLSVEISCCHRNQHHHKSPERWTVSIHFTSSHPMFSISCRFAKRPLCSSLSYQPTLISLAAVTASSSRTMWTDGRTDGQTDRQNINDCIAWRSSSVKKETRFKNVKRCTIMIPYSSRSSEARLSGWGIGH